jgi:hypothetical protein
MVNGNNLAAWVDQNLGNIDVTKQDWYDLANSDDIIRIKGINVALNRMVRDVHVRALTLLHQLKSGEVTLDMVMVSDADWEVMEPEPTPSPRAAS